MASLQLKSSVSTTPFRHLLYLAKTPNTGQISRHSDLYLFAVQLQRLHEIKKGLPYFLALDEFTYGNMLIEIDQFLN
jgi:hypothetical protein